LVQGADTGALGEKLDDIAFLLKALGVLMGVMVLFLLLWFGTWLGRT
jgi:hypothetical protein